VFLECPSQVFQRGRLARVIGCERWASQALSKHFVTGANSGRVVGGGEDIALDLAETSSEVRSQIAVRCDTKESV